MSWWVWELEESYDFQFHQCSNFRIEQLGWLEDGASFQEKAQKMISEVDLSIQKAESGNGSQYAFD